MTPFCRRYTGNSSEGTSRCLSRIKELGRAEDRGRVVGGGKSSQIFLNLVLQRGHRRPQVEVVAVLQHDPSGWPLGQDELVSRRRAVVDVHPHRAQLRLVQVIGGTGEWPSRSCRARVVLVAVPQSRCKEDREHVLDRVGSYEEAERGSCGGAQPLWCGLLVVTTP